MRITYSCSYGVNEVFYRYKGKCNIVRLSEKKFWKFINWLKKHAEFQYYHSSNLNPQLEHGETWVLGE